MKQQGQHQGAGEGAQQLHVQRQRHLGGGHGGGDEEEVKLGQHPREAGDNLEQEDTGDYNNLKMGYIIITRMTLRLQMTPNLPGVQLFIIVETISGTMGSKFNLHYENHN